MPRLEKLAAKAVSKPNCPVLEGHIGYHLWLGNHNLTKLDWEQFSNFADRHPEQVIS